MTVRTGADVGVLLVDGYDLRPYTTELNDDIEAMFEDTHALGDSWVAQGFVGLRKVNLDTKGFYDDAALASNDALVAMSGASRVMCYGLQGNTLGKAFTGIQGVIQASFGRALQRGALHKANAKFSGSGQVDEGLIFFPLGALSGASGTGTRIDNAASSAAGGVGYIHCTALVLGGYTNLAPLLRHSSDDITYNDLIVFTVVTAASAAQRATCAGTVNRYVKTAHSYNGAGSGQSATVFIGFKRN